MTFLALRSEYVHFMLCDFMLKISGVVIDLLVRDRLDLLISHYKSCMSGVNQLFTALLYKIVAIQRTKHPGFEEEGLNAMLFAFAKNSDDAILNFVK
jgi:hypothetical protein